MFRVGDTTMQSTPVPPQYESQSSDDGRASPLSLDETLRRRLDELAGGIRLRDLPPERSGFVARVSDIRPAA